MLAERMTLHEAPSEHKSSVATNSRATSETPVTPTMLSLSLLAAPLPSYTYADSPPHSPIAPATDLGNPLRHGSDIYAMTDHRVPLYRLYTRVQLPPKLRWKEGIKFHGRWIWRAFSRHHSERRRRLRRQRVGRVLEPHEPPPYIEGSEQPRDCRSQSLKTARCMPEASFSAIPQGHTPAVTFRFAHAPATSQTSRRPP